MLALFLDISQLPLFGFSPLLAADERYLFDRSSPDELDDGTLSLFGSCCFGVVDESMDRLLDFQLFDRGVC
jgi:hypothetical protein